MAAGRSDVPGIGRDAPRHRRRGQRVLGSAGQAGRQASRRLVADLSPEDIADIVDYRSLTYVLDRDEALAILRRTEAGKAERIAILEREGYACYTTSAGWLGYDDAEMRRLCQEAVDAGFNHVKMKVGRDLADDIRRLTAQARPRALRDRECHLNAAEAARLLHRDEAGDVADLRL